MKSHVKIYHEAFNITPGDFISCEICGEKAVDIHHIHCKGMGGSKIKDNIHNLMALCRECHAKYGDKKQYIEFLQANHDSIF